MPCDPEASYGWLATANGALSAIWAGPSSGWVRQVRYCGKVACGRCLCNFNERERPAYRMGVHNDINWCMANTSSMFHCTTSIIVGAA